MNRLLGLPHRDVEVDAPDRLGRDVRFTKVARIGRQAATEVEKYTWARVKALWASVYWGLAA